MTEELFQEFVFDADAKTVIDFIVSGSWRIDGGSFAVGEISSGPKMAFRDVWAVEGAFAFYAMLSAANGPRGWGVSLDNVEVADGGQVYFPKRDVRWQPLEVAPPDVRKHIKKRGITIPKIKGSWCIAHADYGGTILILQQRPGECIARLFVESNPARWNNEKRDSYLPKQKAHEFIGAVWRGIVEGWLSRKRLAAKTREPRGRNIGTDERVRTYHEELKRTGKQRAAQKTSHCDPRTYAKYCLAVTGEEPLEPYTE